MEKLQAVGWIWSSVGMKSHSGQHREQRVPSRGSRNTQVYSSSGSRGDPSVAVSHLCSTRVVSQPHSCSIGSSSHGQLPPPTDAQWRLAETDRWSVDSPKESGYYSEESSVGHNADACSSMHQGLHGSESCSYSSLYLTLAVWPVSSMWTRSVCSMLICHNACSVTSFHWMWSLVKDRWFPCGVINDPWIGGVTTMTAVSTASEVTTLRVHHNR